MGGCEETARGHGEKCGSVCTVVPHRTPKDSLEKQTMIHLAILPDGNRRWAKAHGLPPWKGHEKAVEGFRAIMDWVRERGDIGVLTLWCFSTENWKRDEKEVDALMRLFEEYLRKEHGELLKNDIRFVHSGRKDRF